MAGGLKHEDQIISLIGEIGKWQWILIILIGLLGIPTSWQILVMSFLTPKSDFFCKPKFTDENSEAASTNLTYQQWKDLAESISPENKTILSECNVTRYDEEANTLTNTSEVCTEWLFDHSFYKSTLITDFDLVCSRDWYITLSQGIYMVGILFGAVVSGMVSDRFGRKKTIIVAAFGLILFGVLAAFATSIYMFVALRFVVAFFTISLFTTAFCYCMEIVSGKWAVIIGIGLEFPWAIGYSVLPALAYAVPEWSHLQLAITLPVILFVFAAFIIPESPRWLLAKNRLEEADDVVDRGMEINGRQWDESMKLVRIETEQDSASVLDLFRTPNMRKKTLVQYYLWFTCSMVYYGLTLNTGSLLPDGDLYINFLVAALIEFPAYILTIFVLLFLGRKYPLSGMMLLGGIALLLMLVVPDGTPQLVMSNIGKFGITAAFAAIYLYAAELYPTVVRNTGLGSSSMFARVGSILAPYIGRELSKISKTIPILIFAVCSILAGILTLFLPETKGKLLPDTIEEGEDFGKGESILCCKLRKDNSAKTGQDNPVYN